MHYLLVYLQAVYFEKICKQNADFQYMAPRKNKKFVSRRKLNVVHVSGVSMIGMIIMFMLKGKKFELSN